MSSEEKKNVVVEVEDVFSNVFPGHVLRPFVLLPP